MPQKTNFSEKSWFLTIFCDISLFLQNGWPLTQVDHDKNCHCLPQKRVSSKGDFSLIEQSNQIFWKKWRNFHFCPFLLQSFLMNWKSYRCSVKTNWGINELQLIGRNTHAHKIATSLKNCKKISKFWTQFWKKLKIF